MKSSESILARFTKHRGRAFSALCAMLLATLLAVPSFVTYGQKPGEKEEAEKLVPEEFKDQIKYLSTVPSMMAAESLGIKEERPRPRDVDISHLPKAPDIKNIGTNVGIGVHPTKHENEPTVVANPQDSNILVAGSHFFGPPAPTTNRCQAYRSTDGGLTWSAPVEMPSMTASSSHSDPVLAYAPDGNRVYYAYMDIKPATLGGFDVVVSFSNDNGATWIGPVLVLDGSGLGPFAIQYDKPWIGTHVDVPGPQDNNRFVYVTATAFRVALPPSPIPPISIAFTSSANLGITWGIGSLLDSVPDISPQQVVQGSRPIGGLGGEVLVAWYYSGMDGFLTGNFQIRTARSANNGLTFSPPINAATDSFEVPFFLGPFAGFQRWWLTMAPDVEIDTGGVAHIVYTHDPVAGSTTAEDGDIRYVSSAGPPYNAWTAPVTISDDPSGQAQGFAALETTELVQHAIWEDHRLSPAPAANIFYDVFYTRNLGGGWEANSRVTDASSLGDFNFNGDYFDLTTSSSLIFGIWTDRRDKISIFDDEDDVWGAVISP